MLNRQINDFGRRVITREQLAFLDSLADHAVERFNGVRRVDGLSDVSRVVKQRIEIVPVTTPGTTDLGVLVIPAFTELIECEASLLFGGRLIEGFVCIRSSLHARSSFSCIAGNHRILSTRSTAISEFTHMIHF